MCQQMVDTPRDVWYCLDMDNNATTTLLHMPSNTIVTIADFNFDRSAGLVTGTVDGSPISLPARDFSTRLVVGHRPRIDR